MSDACHSPHHMFLHFIGNLISDKKSLTKRGFAAFRCVSVSEDKKYMEHDFAIECYKQEHIPIITLSISGLILYGIGIPLFLLNVLVINRHLLHGEGHPKYQLAQFRLGDFFQTYEKQWYFWEVIVMIEKMLLVGMLGIVDQYSPVQPLVGGIICFSYALVVLRVAPYSSDRHDWLAFYCTLSLSITYLAGLLIALDVNKKEGKDRIIKSKDEVEAVSVILVVVCSFPVVYYAWGVFVMAKSKCKFQENAIHDPGGRQTVVAPAEVRSNLRSWRAHLQPSDILKSSR